MVQEGGSLQVWAVDANEEQLKQCKPHPSIQYRTGPAESTGVPSSSVDLVTVATALHWYAWVRGVEALSSSVYGSRLVQTMTYKFQTSCRSASLPGAMLNLLWNVHAMTLVVV